MICKERTIIIIIVVEFLFDYISNVIAARLQFLITLGWLRREFWITYTTSCGCQLWTFEHLNTQNCIYTILIRLSFYSSHSLKYQNSTRKMAYRVPFLEAVKIRRSILSLAKSSPISDDRIVEIVNHGIKHAPSAFNVQSCRAIVLFGEEHNKLWNFGLQRAKETMPPQVFANYEGKIKGFGDAYGTVSQANLNFWWPLIHSIHRFCSLKTLLQSRSSHLNSKTSWPNTPIVSPNLPAPNSIRQPFFTHRVRALERHESIHHLDRTRDRRTRLQSPALSSHDQ